MADSAAVVVSRGTCSPPVLKAKEKAGGPPAPRFFGRTPTEHRERTVARAWAESLLTSSLTGEIAFAFRSFLDRVRAKLAYHDSKHRQELVRRAFNLVGAPTASIEISRTIRKLDPDGLGIWYLARISVGPQLVDLCRRALSAPGSGPPRPVARLLERALAGKPVSWFGASGGFDALMTNTLINTALSTALVASELAGHEHRPSWPSALANLTVAANAVQRAVRAYHRVVGQPLTGAVDAAGLVYQAMNVARRALNRTDLLAVDEILVRDTARLALSATSAACKAAIELTKKILGGCQEVAEHGPEEKLLSLARTVDALASRVAISLRNEEHSNEGRTLLLDQSTRVVTEALKALRPWGIPLTEEDPISRGEGVLGVCRRSNALAEAASETLESWAVLHELFQPSTPPKPPTHSEAGPAAPPVWATRLVETVTGQGTTQNVVDSIRELAAYTDRAVAGAACIAAAQASLLPLRPGLWKLIRDARSSDTERSLAFQAFCRFESAQFLIQIR